jgi:hypothetical protein
MDEPEVLEVLEESMRRSVSLKTVIIVSDTVKVWS